MWFKSWGAHYMWGALYVGVHCTWVFTVGIGLIHIGCNTRRATRRNGSRPICVRELHQNKTKWSQVPIVHITVAWRAQCVHDQYVYRIPNPKYTR